MSHQQWRRLAETLSSDWTGRYTLPGDIDVDARGDFVQVAYRPRP